jgi:hypothetical protein
LDLYSDDNVRGQVESLRNDESPGQVYGYAQTSQIKASEIADTMRDELATPYRNSRRLQAQSLCWHGGDIPRRV